MARRLSAELQLQHGQADPRRRIVPLAIVPRASREPRLTSSLALVLLGFGVGVLVVAGRSNPHTATLTPREHTEMLRARAEDAQQRSAHASQLARDLMAQWSVAENAARRESH
jgi:hypothetical protein